jgi:hypothetical protein
MFNFLKNKPTIPENEFGITPEDIRLILKDTQTWGTDEKVFNLLTKSCWLTNLGALATKWKW